MKPLLIAITGGIASGKTTAARMFIDFGDSVLDADQVVHDAYSMPEVQQRIATCAPGTVGTQGVDTKALRQAICAHPRLLTKLEDVLHPIVRQTFQRAIDGCRTACFVGVIPLLYESSMQDMFTKVIALSIDTASQRQRVLARPGLDEQWWSLIRARQMEQDTRNARSDCVIAGDLPLAELKQHLLRLRRVWLDQHSADESPNHKNKTR